jgi:predicted negative regulator of RcsB-dependent stress response
VESEDQQVEALKQWWNDNGRAVVLGVVVGLGSVGGYIGWQRHVESNAEAASVAYSRIVNTAAIQNHSGAVSEADTLIGEQPQSAYAALAALVAASSAYEANDADNAIRLLRFSAEHAPEPEVADVARLRLARLLAEAEDYDGALTALGAVSGDTFTDLVAETRGDVLQARGDRDGAREAYERVLDNDDVGRPGRTRVQAKLDRLAATDS